MRESWLCGRKGSGDPLDRHHIFGEHTAARARISDRTPGFDVVYIEKNRMYFRKLVMNKWNSSLFI